MINKFDKEIKQMKSKVLILDDDLESLIHVIDFLNESFEVSACDNEKDFFEIIYKKKFDIILLDINMPNTSGLEVCEKLKNIEIFKCTPVIFVTAFSDIDKIEKGFSLGAIDYVVKPFKPQELKIRITAHIKNSIIQKKLRDEHLELNKEIKTLTKELIIAKNQILSEENFYDREDTFKSTNKEVEERKIATEKFNSKFEEIQKKLEAQKKLLQDTKLLLEN